MPGRNSIVQRKCFSFLLSNNYGVINDNQLYGIVKGKQIGYRFCFSAQKDKNKIREKQKQRQQNGENPNGNNA